MLELNHQNEDFEVAHLSDVSELVALVNSAYRGEASELGWTTEALLLDGQRTDKEKIVELLSYSHSIILVARVDQRIVACVHLEKKNEQCAYLGMLSVAPSQQDKGWGRKLLLAAESYVQNSWKTLQVEMTVISLREELISWYLRRGYSLSEERRPFPMNNPRFGIPKRKDLEFVVLFKNMI